MKERITNPATSPRFAYIALIALACIAVACLLQFGVDPGKPAPVDVAPEEPARETSTATPAIASRSEPARELVKTAVYSDREPGAMAADCVRVRGTIVVVDPKGVEHAQEDGKLHIRISNASAANARFVSISELAVTVRKGAFSIDVPPTDKIELDGAILGGRPTYFSEPLIPLREIVELRATWPAPTILRVVDSEHGLDLTEITVVASSNLRPTDRAHPGIFQPQSVRIEGGRSPLQLASPEADLMQSEETLWVHSPGYAWGRLTVSYKNTTERRVELHRGGTLEVRVEGRFPQKRKLPRRQIVVEGAEDPDEPRIRLRKPPKKLNIEARVREALDDLAKTSKANPNGRPRPTRAELRRMIEQDTSRTNRGKIILDAKARLGAPIVLTGVPPGPHVVTVEVGPQSSPLVLGEIAVTIMAGTTRNTVVAVALPTERATVPLSGTFFLAPAWGRDNTSLSFTPLDFAGKTSRDDRHISLREMKRVRATPGLNQWDAGLVAPGRYIVRCLRLNLHWVVDTGPSGNNLVELRVGEPIDVSVQVQEEATSRRIAGEYVLWSPEGRGGSGQAEWNATRRRYEFRVAAGRVRVDVLSKYYSTSGPSVFNIQSNNREFVVSVRRNCGVVLLLKHGETTIPWDEGSLSALNISTLEGTDAAQGSGAGENGVYLAVSKPGTYQVSVPDQPGFEPVPPIEIVLSSGKFIEHKVQLRRLR